MARPPVTLSVSDDGIATVAICSDDGRNALDETFVVSLSDAIAGAAADSRARVILMSGTESVFCSGASKELLIGLASGDLVPSDIQLPRVLLGVPLPVIAAVEGHAVGGGFALALCADIVVLARESRYGCNFMQLGITPGMGTTRLLEHVLSPAIAHELLFTAELRRGADFVGCGGINHVVPKVEVLPKALDIAGRIAEKPRAALQILKRSIAERRVALFEEALSDEVQMHQSVLALPETRKRIEAEFVE